MTYGMMEEDYNDDAIKYAARQANAHDFITKMQHGYNSMLGESGNNLSGGQKQRLSIARAFLRKPQLLLLDEATSALDSENEKQIQQALDDMVKAMAGVSIVMIAHRLSTVMGADKIIVLDEGTVCEQGSHRELMDLDCVYASLVRRQTAIATEDASGAGVEEGERVHHSGERGHKGKGDDDGSWGAKGSRDFKGKSKGGMWADDDPRSAKGSGEVWGKGKRMGVTSGKHDESAGAFCGGKGALKGRFFWEKFAALSKQSDGESKKERKLMLQRRMHHVLSRALDLAGVDEVSDAIVDSMRGVIDSELEGVSEASAHEGPPDSIDRLFREVQHKTHLLRRQE
eukprot:TRINITY_DN35118_c0_g1_i1.p2 TRINITY_DN35118_c0_g1~~TRINITY_DN35118_c0_g1_i1.p2  ORF type:complete len:342 (-),score=71.86 TRINITY_DN35118_c0_g1_i1:361-1386(-)